MQVDEDSAKVKFPPPLIYLSGLLTGYLLDWLSGEQALDLAAAVKFGIGAAFLLVGFAVMLSGATRFRRRGTNLEPWRTSTVIVDDGIYSWTRNPMYLGMALVYLGLAIALESLSALILLPIVLILIRFYVIAREERYLEGKFGEEYRLYKSRVRRWI